MRPYKKCCLENLVAAYIGEPDRQSLIESHAGLNAEFFSSLSGDISPDSLFNQLIEALTSGGDARLVLEAETGLNRYYSAPYPRDVIAFASSTANDISRPAFDHLLAKWAAGTPAYSDWLDDLRSRIRSAYSLSRNVEIAFAPSGTDLEYVALAAVAGRSAGGIHNILLGADEVGSGCIFSAHGQYFAETTARGIATTSGDTVEGLETVSLIDIPVRDAEGTALSSRQCVERIRQQLQQAQAADRFPVVHVVHGSKTGLILPSSHDLAELASEWKDRALFVVDACQARMHEDVAAQYLDLGCIVFVTGSKFMGGPPFSGVALIPRDLVEKAAPLPAGFRKIFRAAEWPSSWVGGDDLADEENAGLALRLEAAIFELERYVAIPPADREAVIALFRECVSQMVSANLGFEELLPHHPDEPERGERHPTAMRTLTTLDVSNLDQAPTFAAAQAMHRQLVDHGVRLGQPVKCIRREDEEWAGTLRIGLSMPQISMLARLSSSEAKNLLEEDLARVARAIQSLG